MKIKQKKEKPGFFKRSKRRVTIKVGTHKKVTLLLWLLLIGSLSFGIYKNFTAIDHHTVHEKEIVEEKLLDTNRIESFVESFAKEYYAWQQDQKELDNRSKQLENYLTEDLQQLNAEMIRSDIPTASVVRDVQIWQVAAIDDETYDVLFSVTQQLTENKKNTAVSSTYTVSVHVDSNGNMVIVKNPTVNSQPQKSTYKPKQAENDGSVDAATTDEITEFLETFYKLYPSATEQELAYYIRDNALSAINKDYVFVELVDPVYAKTDESIRVILTVKYLDKETNATQLSQFDLTLVKQGNWQIVK